MRLAEARAEMILKLFVEGVSIRSIERLTEVHRDTIMSLLVLAGERCEKLMGRKIVNVPVRDVECDEIWAFVQKKEGHKAPEEAHDETIGDAYCFVAIERNTKLVLNFALGRRSKATTDIFIEGLRTATANQDFQITTDGFAPYVKSISDTLAPRGSPQNRPYGITSKPANEKSSQDTHLYPVRPIAGNGFPQPDGIEHILISTRAEDRATQGWDPSVDPEAGTAGRSLRSPTRPPAILAQLR
jgi:IS1 family transposase